MTRYCASCGTEVDENAIFCPTCGQPIDQETETEMPAAPAWPEPEPGATREPDAFAEPARAAPPPDPFPEPVSDPPAMPPPAADEPTRATVRPDPAAAAPPPPQSPVPGERPTSRPVGPSAGVPFTAPVTMSAWLIGVGAAVAALGALVGLFDASGLAVDLVMLVALAGVAATVFFPTALPAVPHLRFITLVVVLVAFGAGLDRLGEGRAGAGDLLLFLGAAAAVIGAVLLELGHDQPLGGPQT